MSHLRQLHALRAHAKAAGIREVAARSKRQVPVCTRWIRQHTSAYVSSIRRNKRGGSAQQTSGTCTPAYASIRSTRQHTQHTSAYSAYASIRRHTTAYVSIRSTQTPARRQHTTAHIRQHTQHTSAYVRMQRSPQESYIVTGSAARDSARTIFSYDRHRAQLALIHRLALTSGKTRENTSDRRQTEMHGPQLITRLHTLMNASMNAVHYLWLCLLAQWL